VLEPVLVANEVTVDVWARWDDVCVLVLVPPLVT
jgi:hypothetical protein